MSAYLSIKILGVVSAVVGPMPDWNSCTNYLPDFEKQTDRVFNSLPEAKADLEKKYPGIKRTDIVHECTENKPEIGK